MKEECNGFSNKETWALVMCVGSFPYFADTVPGFIKGLPEEGRAMGLRDLIVGMVGKVLNRVKNGGTDIPEAWISLIQEVGSFWRVNWQEAVNAILDE